MESGTPSDISQVGRWSLDTYPQLRLTMKDSVKSNDTLSEDMARIPALRRAEVFAMRRSMVEEEDNIVLLSSCSSSYVRSTIPKLWRRRFAAMLSREPFAVRRSLRWRFAAGG